jgi:lysozyme
MTTLILDLHGDHASPDWNKLQDNGVRGVFLKATEGLTFEDDKFVSRWKAADAAGLIVGSYHFSRQDNHPTLAGARDEADHYIAQMRKLSGHHDHAWQAGNFVPVLDFEVGTPDKRYSPWRDAFQQRVLAQTGHATMLYTYPSFNNWTTPSDPNQRRLWIADYDDNPNLSLSQVDNRLSGRRASLPGGYDDHDLWQFTSNLAMPGSNGRVDASILPRGREGALDAVRCHRDGS